MNQATAEFISLHAHEDVRQLAFLRQKHPEVDMPFALDQIRGRQMARVKLPRWAQTDGLLYPPHISMEQCSSEFTAMYKADLAWEKLGGKMVEEDGTIQFVDLTGGFGVDFSYMAERLGIPSLYVERQAHLCEMARENFSLLGLDNAEVRQGDGVEVLHQLDKPLMLIYIDPARRDDAGNKVVGLADCTPDVTQIASEMLEKSKTVIIKLSPMLDWHQAVAELPCVREVHIVSVGNECKELLLVLQREPSDFRVVCVNDDQRFVFGEEFVSAACTDSAAVLAGKSPVYLYEPNASLMKAGCFSVLNARFRVKMLAQNSHLFVSDCLIADFPGRSFEVLSVCSLNKKELKRNLQGMTQANITTRNFPLSVAELRKRLKLKDGGDTYIFATTLQDNSHVLLIGKKVSARSL